MHAFNLAAFLVIVRFIITQPMYFAFLLGKYSLSNSCKSYLSTPYMKICSENFSVWYCLWRVVHISSTSLRLPSNSANRPSHSQICKRPDVIGWFCLLKVAAEFCRTPLFDRIASHSRFLSIQAVHYFLILERTEKPYRSHWLQTNKPLVDETGIWYSHCVSLRIVHVVSELHEGGFQSMGHWMWCFEEI